MKIRTKILSLGGLNITIQLVTLAILVSIFSSLLSGFGEIIEKANVNKQLTQKSQQNITSASLQVEQMVTRVTELNTLIGDTNNSIKILEKKISSGSESLSAISEAIETVLDTVEDESIQDQLFDMADSIGDLQEIMKREALVSLQSSVKSMDESTTKVGEQLAEINSMSSNLDQMKKGGSEVAKGSEEILSISTAFGESIRTNKILLTALILGCAILAIFFSVVIARSITVPVLKVVDMVKDIAQGEGDLTKRLAISTKDELGQLASWLNMFIERINNIIVNITMNAETVTASSQELLIASKQVSSGTGELSHKADAVATATDEMSRKMNSVAAATEEASDNISVVSESAAYMQEMLGNVALECDKAKVISGDATAQVDTAAERVSFLGQAAQEISKVTEVITDIAEQTNLLALNATIEAARAGDSGKGFAVVAGEIKELAGQTASATKEIRERIETIQGFTDDTVSDVTKISEVITDVNGIVVTIAESVQEQSANSSTIAENIGQAAAGIVEVNTNVVQSSQVSADIAQDIAGVNSVTTDMSKTSAYLNQSADDLSALSANLRDMISVFKISKENVSSKCEEQVDESVPDLLPWDEKFSTGISEVDKQHQKLVGLLNRQHKVMRAGKTDATALVILKELAEYTDYHFKTEERLFVQYQYPASDQHIKTHQGFTEKVFSFYEQVEAGSASINMDIMTFLRDWLKNHILKDDQHFAGFYADHVEK